MKKYIAPSLKVVKVESQNLCLGSQGQYNNGLTTTARGHRGLTDWDDDEE